MGKQELIDLHVHIIGDGSSGSGCWIKLGGWNRVLARLMLRDLGIPGSALRGGLDELYAQRLLSLLKESSLSRALILAHEEVYDEQGRKLERWGSFYVPNDYVLELARKHVEFLPAVAIHPARADAMAELERTAALGAVMLKLLPNCQNVDCSQKRYRPFWRKLSDLGLPFLAHTGGELSVRVYDRKFQDPMYLQEPLEQGVTVIAAHVASASHPLDRDYVQSLSRLMELYPNLYADNSALATPFRSKAISASMLEPLRSRMLYGSDFPIPVSGAWPRLRGLLSREQAQEIKAEANPLERDLKLKKLLGYPEQSFYKLNSLLPDRARG